VDEKSCSGCINIRCDEYIKFHIQKSEEKAEAIRIAEKEIASVKLAGLQAELTKSEGIYPTKEQIDSKIKNLASSEDVKGINYQLKALWALIVVILGIIIDLLRR